MLIVVGGHSRNIGKTSLVEGLIRRFRERRWTAVKITQFGHHVCSNHGETCGCETGAEEAFSLSEEYAPGDTDSARFLKAGANRSLWLRTRAGELHRAEPAIRKILAQNENVIMESNSVIELVRPDVFLMLLDFGCADFKPSSLRLLGRADAFVIVDRGSCVPPWENAAQGISNMRPRFPIKPPAWVTAAIANFVSGRFPTSAR